MLAFAKATHIFFSKSNSVYAIFNDQSFNDTLTNDIVCFEQLGPDIYEELIRNCKGVNCKNGFASFLQRGLI